VANPLWSELAARAGLSLDQSQEQNLYRYLDLLLAANQRMNLTRITNRAQADLLHVADAMTLLRFLPKSAHRLADVGSGGGVPGMVLAILRPDIEIVLIESTRKKARFLAETAEALALSNVHIEALRAEEVGRSKMRESFNVVTARAVAPMDVLAQWLLPLAKIGGIMLAMKGTAVEQELADARRVIGLAGGGEATIFDSSLLGTSHNVVKIEKIAATRSEYPAPATAGKPKRRGAGNSL
jgi:16S rRNA (guanine527-N7)-methyltransferase